jgi:hypothetical protein
MLKTMVRWQVWINHLGWEKQSAPYSPDVEDLGITPERPPSRFDIIEIKPYPGALPHLKPDIDGLEITTAPLLTPPPARPAWPRVGPSGMVCW